MIRTIYKNCVKWSLCSIFYITMIRYTNGQGIRGAMERAKVMDATGSDYVGSPTTCGTVRVLSQSDVYVFRDQDVNSMSLARLNRRSKRFKRSASPSGFDSQERFDPDMENEPRPGPWGTDIQPGNVPKPRGFSNRNRRPVHPGQFSRANQPVNNPYMPSGFAGSRGKNSQLRAMSKPRLATLFSNFSHRETKQKEYVYKKPIPDTFVEHMEKQFGGKFNDERRKFPGTPQLLPVRNPVLEGVEPPSKPMNKKDMLKDIKRVSNNPESAMDRRNRRRMMARRQMTPPTINLISPVSDAPPIPDHKHTATDGQEGNQKLPLYIEHILEDNVRNDPVLSKQQRPMPRPMPEEIRNPEMNSPHDILGSLGPEKLEQLRKLLNSATGPYGGSGDLGQSQMLDPMDAGRSPRYRQKRSLTSPGFPFEKLAGQMNRYQGQRLNSPIRPRRGRVGEVTKSRGQSKRCNWIFNSQCKKIIVKLDYIIDGVRDCSREYLKIKAGNSTELFCGAVNHGSNLPQIEGEGKVSIEHFRSSEAAPHDKIRFKGSVYCE